MLFMRCLPALALCFASMGNPAKAEPQTSPATIAAAPTSEVSSDAAKPAEATIPVPSVAPKPTVPGKPVVTLQAKVDLTHQTMTVIERGKTLASWKISSGVEEHATPRGVFQPEWTAKMWYSRTYDNAPMPHAVFFRNGAAVHATQATGALGRAASHGCVRLAPVNAEAFYKLVQRHGLVHTRIAVFGEPQYAKPLVAHRASQPPQRLASVRQVSYVSNSPFAAPAYTRAFYPPLRGR